MASRCPQLLNLLSGCREGKSSGDTWQCHPTDTSCPRAGGSPQRGRSDQRLPLSVAVDALGRHLARQREERLLLGLEWDDHGLVFLNTVGKPLHPSNFLQRSFYPLLERAGLPRIRFHDLRHSAATLLLGLGIHPKIVSEMLGHSQIAITLDLYSHVTATMQQEAVRAFEGLFGSQIGSQEGATEQ
jgi:integrase